MTQQRHWIGLLLGGVLAWSVVLGLTWYFAVPVLFVNLLLTCLAVSAPAFFIGRGAVGGQVRKPVLLTLAAYVGGAALAIAGLQAFGPVVAGGPQRIVGAFLVHLFTLTLFVPAADGGYQLFPVNLLWLALAGMTASIAAEAAAKRAAPTPGKTPKTRSTAPGSAREATASRPRPRRRRSGRGGTGEADGG